MVKSPVFDTSVFSPFGKQIERQIATALFPSIVFYELCATNIRRKHAAEIRSLAKNARTNRSHLNSFCYRRWETAKSVRRLYLKKTAPVSKLRTIQNDALIARLAVKNNGFVVTMDVDDFEILKTRDAESGRGSYFFG